MRKLTPPTCTSWKIKAQARYIPKLNDVRSGGILIVVAQGTRLGISTTSQPY